MFSKTTHSDKWQADDNHVIDFFAKYGFDQYYLTLNYKSNLMVAYFNSLENKIIKLILLLNQNLWGLQSIKLLEDKLPESFIVSNCDSIVNTDFSEIIKQHQEKITNCYLFNSASQIPYGKINYKNGGSIISIEKNQN